MFKIVSSSSRSNYENYKIVIMFGMHLYGKFGPAQYVIWQTIVRCALSVLGLTMAVIRALLIGKLEEDIEILNFSISN